MEPLLELAAPLRLPDRLPTMTIRWLLLAASAIILLALRLASSPSYAGTLSQARKQPGWGTLWISLPTTNHVGYALRYSEERSFEGRGTGEGGSATATKRIARNH